MDRRRCRSSLHDCSGPPATFTATMEDWQQCHRIEKATAHEADAVDGQHFGHGGTEHLLLQDPLLPIP
ncbi:hypothetical protein E2562_017976 [Oryza meyeriana var. granulata]|uniref:Uncharacterized protein n=1 Tax=Oryza meyeriana var. granulata TaxID=110450 RepID=A0A6G1F921_9ORYZ|nr:hypothetical protein E2562_017976 [Oryza meyeriana var. granulata]